MELEELVQRIQRWKQRMAAEEAGTLEEHTAEEESRAEAPLDIVEPVDGESSRFAARESEDTDLSADIDLSVNGDAAFESMNEVEEEIEPISVPPEDVVEVGLDSLERDDEDLN